jgi:hypothetical protein
MKPSLRSAPRAIVLVALISVASSACVKQNEPGVGLVKFNSTAVFGAPKKNDIPGFGTADEFGDEIPISDADLPSLRLTPPKPADPGPCPPAKLTAFPKASASVKVLGVPAVGVYKWKRALVVSKDASKDPAQTSRPFALESRAIRRFARQSDHQFSFEMVSPDALVPGNSVVTGFVVNTSSELLVNRTLPSRTIGVVDVPGTDLRQTNPSDPSGIFISSVVQQDGSGKEISAFRPVRPMLVTPLDGGIIRPGQAFNSVGIDASAGAVLANAGTVLRTSRIDACGEIVEGFAVLLKQTYTADIPLDDVSNALSRYASRKETREVSYVFATQYGALPIGETLSIGDVELDPTAFLAKWELGGLTPTALPDTLK